MNICGISRLLDNVKKSLLKFEESIQHSKKLDENSLVLIRIYKDYSKLFLVEIITMFTHLTKLI